MGISKVGLAHTGLAVIAGYICVYMCMYVHLHVCVYVNNGKCRHCVLLAVKYDLLLTCYCRIYTNVKACMTFVLCLLIAL